MNKKLRVINWVIGIILANLGVCLCTKADFGISMIGASPYIVHVWLRDRFPWYTQGTSEYIWEALILVIGCIIVRRFKLKYLLSFMTAVIAGLAIDGWFFVLGGNGAFSDFTVRIVMFSLGTLATALGIAFFFNTKMPMQVYELVVAEVSDRYDKDLNKVKYVNDIILLLVAVILSFALTRKFTGIGVGTVVITLLNAPLIGFFRKVICKIEKL